MDSILLVSPRSPFLDSDRIFPPLGILYLKGILDKHGLYSQLEDEFDFENIGKYRKFDYIAISCVTPQRKEAERILQKIKENFPLKKVIIGGAHANFYTDDCKKGDYNHIVIRDGEKSIINIASGRNSERIHNELLDSEEMNSMPLPYRNVDFIGKYHYQLDGLEATTMITSRGCPFGCAFCEHAKAKVRYYQVSRIRKELIQITELGYKAVMFFDDLFAVSQKRVDELCGIINDFQIKFRCFGHVKCMTPKMAETLARAGCVETGVGIESGSQKILDTVKFPTPTIKESRDYVKICHDAGIRVKAFLMLGLPGETPETIKETEEFIATSGIDDFDLSIFYPYQGTRIRDQIEGYDLFLETDNGLGYFKGRGGSAESLVRTSVLSAEKIKSEKERIFTKYKYK